MAGKRSVKYDIESKDKTKAGVTSALRNLKGFDSSLQSMTKQWGSLLKFGAITGGLTAIVKGFGELNKAYDTQASAEAGLASAISRNPLLNGVSEKNLQDFASEIQRTARIGDEDLIPMLSKMASLGFDETQIEKTTEAALDMSSALGKDLESTLDQLIKTLGGTAGELGELHPALKDMSAEALRAGAGIEYLGEKFMGAAEDNLTPYGAAISDIKNNFGDLMEVMGRGLQSNGVFTGLLTFVGRLIGKWTDAISEIQKYRDAKRNIASEDALVAAQARVTVAQRNQDVSKEISEVDVTLLMQQAGFSDLAEFIVFDLISQGLSEFNANALVKYGEGDLLSKYLSASYRYNEDFNALTNELEDAQRNLARVEARLAPGSTGDGGSTGSGNTGTTSGSTSGYQSERNQTDGWVGAGRGHDLMRQQAQFDRATIYADDAEIEVPDSAWDKLTDGLKGSLDGLASVQAMATKGLTSFTDKLMDGDIWSKIIGLIIKFVGLGDILGEIFSMIGTFGDAIQGFIKPLLLAQTKPLADMLGVLGNVVGRILVPLIEILNPIINATAKAFEYLYNYGLRFLITGVIWAVEAIKALGKTIFYLVTFQWRKIKKVWTGGFSDPLEKIEPISTTDDYSGSSSGTGAAYTAQGDIYVYQTNNVGTLVGEDGMDEFTVLMRDRFERLDIIGA